jgi:hypothetical protein
LAWLLKKARDWRSELDEEQEKPVADISDAFSMDDFTPKPEKKEPAYEPGRYVKRPGTQYLWDTKENKYVGFNTLDANGKPGYNVQINEEQMEPQRADDPFDTKSDEYKELINLASFIERNGVPGDKVDKTIHSIPLNTIGDINALAVRLWTLAQQYGISREKLLKHLS